MTRKLLLVLAGGFCGALTRYLLSKPLLALAGALPGMLTGFPYDILLINLSGAFAIGLLYGAFEQGAPLSTDLRLALGTGFLGAYTTFSSFMVGAGDLLIGGRLVAVALYLLGASFAGLALSFAGYALAGQFMGWRRAAWLRADGAEPWIEALSEDLLTGDAWQEALSAASTALDPERERLLDAEGSVR